MEDSGPVGDAGSASVPPEAQSALVALVGGTGGAVALGAPLLPQAEALRDDSRLDSPLMRDDAARESVVAGVSGMSVVTDPMCVTYTWSGLSVNIAFASCTLEATGLPLDGMLGLAVSFAPIEIRMTFAALQVGDLSLDGMVGIRTGGGCPMGMDTCLNCRDTDPTCMEMRAPQQTIFADLTVSLTEDFTITIMDGTVTHDAAGSAVSGIGMVTGGSLAGTFDAMALQWAMGQCLPSSGTLVYTPPTGAPITVTFLSTTPETGAVEVTLPPFPTTTQVLFTPCAM